MNAPKAGDRVSEYVLVEVIGAGSFGQVWKARHHVWQDQWVAIKIPHDQQFVRNLQKEGVAVHGLKHANIVRAIGLDPFGDPPYFAMEYIDGASLRQVIQKNPKGMRVDAAAAVLRGLLLALEHAHRNGIIHRDIKPENVLIALGDDQTLDHIDPQDVRVTDFGLGKAEAITTNSILQSGSLLSEAGKSISGTLAYMAPEQRDGGETDARTDLYAAGIVLFEMLTGERPSGNDMPSHVRSDLPAWPDQVFSKLYTRRERRYASAGDVLAALDESGRPPIVVEPAGASEYQRLSDVESRGQARRCPQCGEQTPADDNFCTLCGAQLVERLVQCGRCGRYPEADERFCIMCGTRLEPAMA